MANLKIYVNPKNQEALTSEFLSNKTAEQSLIFDEKAQKIYLAGDTYSFHTLTDAQYTKLAEVVADLGEGTIAGIKTNIGPLTDTGITLPESTTVTVTNLLKALQDEIGNLSATGITLGDNVDATVENLLKALQTRLKTVEDDHLTSNSDLTNKMSTTVTSNINSTIGGLTGTATGGATGVTGAASHIKVTVSSQSGQVHDVIVNEEDIASASALSTLDESAVKSVNGATGNTVVIDGTDILVGNSATGGATSAYAGNSISSAIAELQKAINDLGGEGNAESLTSILEKINAIKAEIMDTDSTTEGDLLNSLLDSLSALKTKSTAFTGINSDGTVGTGVALQTALENLVTYASGQASAAQAAAISAAAQDATTKANSAQATAISSAQSKDEALEEKLLGTQGTTGATIYGAKLDAANALAAAQSAAEEAAAHHSVVQGPTGTASSNAYVMVSASTGASGQQVYTVQSTQALDNAINGVVSWSVIGA